MTEWLRDHTTFHVGGPADSFVEARSVDALVDAVAQADAKGQPVLLLSGGSNLLVSDAGFPGVVVKVATRGIEVDDATCEWDADRPASRGSDAPASCGGVLVKVAAGESWDAFVDFCVRNEYVGVECLSGIPGCVGSTPIQNVGAYGQEVSQTIWSVRTFDREARSFKTFAAGDCHFGYRHSRFKGEPGRYVVLEVTFQLRQGSLSTPLRYGELATALGVSAGERAPLAQVREEVLRLRRSKGMVVDPADHDTWSAGSFFTNPLMDAAVAAQLPLDAPRFLQPDGRVKSSAAWLIDRAGFPRGFGAPPATLSTKHTLALTNRGGASAADVVALARTIRDGVRERFGVTLIPEPVFVGIALDD